MTKIYFLISLTCLIAGCSTNYKLQKNTTMVVPTNYKTLECKEDPKNRTSEVCPKIGIPNLGPQQCEKAQSTCVVFTVKETHNTKDISPGVVVFLGLVPSVQTYEYDISVTQVGVPMQREKFVIYESWSIINTILSLLGGTSNLETEQRKIGKHLLSRYGNGI